MRLRVAICFYDFSDSYSTYCGLTLAKGLHQNNIDVFCITRLKVAKKYRNISVPSFPDTSFTSWEDSRIKNIDVYVMLFTEWNQYPTLRFIKNKFRVLYFFSERITRQSHLSMMYKYVLKTPMFSSSKDCINRLFHKFKISNYIHYAPIGVSSEHLTVCKIKQKDKRLFIIRETTSSLPVFERHDHELAILVQAGFKIGYSGLHNEWHRKRWGYIPPKKRTLVEGLPHRPDHEKFKKAMFLLLTIPQQDPSYMVLTAMAYGCIVLIAYDHEPEHCFFGYNCIKVKRSNVSEQVFNLMEDHELAEGIRNGGYQYVKNYTDTKKHSKHFIDTVCRYMH